MSERIVVQDREELIFLLCEAAEFEHTVMCTYLYAAWSLKRRADASCRVADLEIVDRWRQTLRRVALEEMLHLTLVNNLLSSLGAAPHLSRLDFPIPPGRFPDDVQFSLQPFSEAALAHFAYIERPEGLAITDGEGFAHPTHYQRIARPDLLTPMPQDYVTQGHHGIAQSLRDLVARHGQDAVFVGHGEAQVGPSEFRLPGLFKVVDLDSALRAIEEIVVQGEGAPAHSEESHYALFQGVHEQLLAMRADRPGFEPAFHTVPNPVLADPLQRPDVTLVTDPRAGRVVDLGDALYRLMMRTFAQVFSPSPLPRQLRQGLALAATELMYALTGAAEAAASLPAGITEGAHAGKHAGLSLQMIGPVDQLVQSCAAQILAERTEEIAGVARSLQQDGVPLPGLAERLMDLTGRLNTLHERYETHISVRVDALTQVQAATGASRATAPAETPASSDDDPNVAHTEQVTLRFDTTRCIHSRRCVLGAPDVFLANVQGPWLHPEVTSVERVAELAHGCPSGAITYERHDGGDNEVAPAVNVLRIRENGPYGVRADVDLVGHGRVLRATLCRCGKSRNKPFCDNSHREAGFTATGEPATLASEPLEERGGPLTVDPLPNGPLQVTGNLEICAGTGRTISRVENCRLCRCGGSASKPFCDNTHVRIGFRSDR